MWSLLSLMVAYGPHDVRELLLGLVGVGKSSPVLGIVVGDGVCKDPADDFWFIFNFSKRSSIVYHLR